MKSTRINFFLLRRDVTKAELARRVGINRVTVSAILNGRLIAPGQLDAIAKELGISRRKLESLIGADAPGRRAA